MAKRKSNSSGSLWIIVLLIIILLGAGLYYLKTQSDNTQQVKKQIVQSTSAKKGKFDFYNVLQDQNGNPDNASQAAPKALPNMQQPVLMPLPSAKPRAAIPTPAPTTQQYMLRVATLKDFAAADQMKAELTLLGYNVSIAKVSLDNGLVHRINLGPYASLSDAQAAQADLLKNKYKSVVFKINLDKPQKP